MMKKNIVTHSLFSSIILFISCNITEPPDPPEPPKIPTTEAVGPVGQAYLFGFIKDYVHPSKSVTNTHIYIMNQQDYSDTILSVFVNSTDASFKITEMPEGVYDLIFINDNYLCAKIGKLLFKPGGNTFNNPNSGGYFIDSTVYITNIADSVGRPDAPPFGLQGYVAGVSVYFKYETSDSLAWEIVQDSDCDTLMVYRYNDPVFDPFENDVYVLKCNQIILISEILNFFNWKKEVLLSSPNYEFIEH